MQTTSPRSSLARRLAGLAAIMSLALVPLSVQGQGCVIARGAGGAMISESAGYLEQGEWNLNFAFRWFNADRHFVGDVEQKHRQEEGTQVINDSYFYDFTATYAWSKRLNTSLTIPFVYHDRSSLYEHMGNSSGQRFHTQAAGLGDIRLAANWWLIDPNAERPGNISIGFGIKAPTGDYDATDVFARRNGPEVRFVDSSIQPGDGGWGYTIELQGFRHIKGGLSAYGNAFYLINPEGRMESTGFSIPDSYMARGGFDYRLPGDNGLVLSLGGRIEGVPGTDLIGHNEGRRRPGFIVAVEPGISFSRGRFVGTLTTPIAVHRNRTTSFGSTRAGDASFADYSINASFSYRL